jgi:hypothetical protein
MKRAAASSTKRRRAPQRGFMLLVIMIIGSAAIASAIVLVSVGGSTQQLGIRAETEDRARALAWTGAERAFLYLEEVLTTRRDLDGVLDPASSCTARGRPVYDGSTEVTYDGKVFSRVEGDRGAYLTRFFDDADDLLPDSTSTRPFTNNTPCCGGCEEATPTDNPARDRNRSIYVEVIGYSPGDDVERASHRVRVVRQFVSIAPIAEPAVTISGNLNADDIELCAPVGDMGVGGSVNVAGALGLCGHLTAGATISAPAPSVPSPACAVPCGPVGDPMPDTPLSPAFPGVPNVLRASSPCNFYLRTHNAGRGGMWSWNPERSYGGGTSCASYAGPIVPLPSAANTTEGYCWQPLMTIDAGGAVVDASGGNEDANNWAFRANLGGPPPNAYADWSSVCRGGTAGWPLPAGAGTLACTNCSQAALRYNKADDAWRVTQQAGSAAPAGVYFIVSGTSPLDFQMPANPPDTDLRSDWAPMSFVSLTSLTITGRGNLTTGMGAPFPALVVRGQLNLQGDLMFNGNVFIDGMTGGAPSPALTLDSNSSVFFGRLHVHGDAQLNDTLRVEYYRSLADPNARPDVFPVPVTSRTPL